jgi:glycosyltransferase involved in cell wall biosynthesis
MKILMLAPEPFFEPRGTPISVYFRIMALGRLGHRVDLITYPIGQSPDLPNLRIIRTPNILGLRRVKIGPSLAKIPLDAVLLLRTLARLLFNRYDLIFSHEEAAIFGAGLARIWRRPHIYDMHSSLPQQLRNFEFTRSPLLISLFEAGERFVLRNSRAVIVICPDLMNRAVALGQAGKSFLLENFLDFPAADFSAEEAANKKRELAPRGERVVLYAGNFEPYQGISLLLEAARNVEGGVVFVLVGGSGRALAEMEARASALGIAGRTVFVARVPPARIPLYISLADVLVSPRLSGTNTPLKIYSFLRSGKPIVATNLWTHTQVLNERLAVLTDPNPESLARGIRLALDSEEARERARSAKEFAEREYTLSRYLEKMTRVLELACADGGKAKGN